MPRLHLSAPWPGLNLPAAHPAHVVQEARGWGAHRSMALHCAQAGSLRGEGCVLALSGAPGISSSLLSTLTGMPSPQPRPHCGSSDRQLRLPPPRPGATVFYLGESSCPLACGELVAKAPHPPASGRPRRHIFCDTNLALSISCLLSTLFRLVSLPFVTLTTLHPTTVYQEQPQIREEPSRARGKPPLLYLCGEPIWGIPNRHSCPLGAPEP